MKSLAHTDLTTFYGSASEIYDHLKREQERDVFLHQVAYMAFVGMTIIAAIAFSTGWGIAPWLTVVAVFCFERTLWWGREVSCRSHTMHILTFRRLPVEDMSPMNVAARNSA
ncbi:hypothetical protein [Luteibacter yeojuensis]